MKTTQQEAPHQGQHNGLEAAQRRISVSRNLVARQRAIVRILQRKGQPTGHAEALLDVFEASLALMLSNHKRRGFPTFEGVTLLPAARRSA
jgi:hypothetical protein